MSISNQQVLRMAPRLKQQAEMFFGWLVDDCWLFLLGCVIHFLGKWRLWWYVPNDSQEKVHVLWLFVFQFIGGGLSYPWAWFSSELGKNASPTRIWWNLGGGLKYSLIFTPKHWRFFFIILTHIFQRGWNQQLDFWCFWFVALLKLDRMIEHRHWQQWCRDVGELRFFGTVFLQAKIPFVRGCFKNHLIFSILMFFACSQIKDLFQVLWRIYVFCFNPNESWSPLTGMLKRS